MSKFELFNHLNEQIINRLCELEKIYNEQMKSKTQETNKNIPIKTKYSL